ncbi:hypothetical protein SAMN05216339_101423 [Nitrosomonas eutropha]|uniref:DUF192 domain-containing protein n=1 Tax=Nitrosomonas eutropha TaxID=916 RepID=A0A1I7FD23_9PROT|nr:DUF192 domain-containing protein [Nitrosomonas eutropha]SFU34087.1 hypothetical protein SAMN05216339_101423 [Nitrosomonas eutropha]
MSVARFAGLLALTVTCMTGVAAGGQATVCTLYFSTGQTLYNVPLATTQGEQERGLSKTHDVNAGMLFTWPQAATRVFWMRDTWMPLQVGFFDSSGNLFQIEDMEPNTDTRHESKQPAKMALELALGQYQAMGLVAGKTVLLHGQCN